VLPGCLPWFASKFSQLLSMFPSLSFPPSPPSWAPPTFPVAFPLDARPICSLFASDPAPLFPVFFWDFHLLTFVWVLHFFPFSLRVLSTQIFVVPSLLLSLYSDDTLPSCFPWFAAFEREEETFFPKTLSLLLQGQRFLFRGSPLFNNLVV